MSFSAVFPTQTVGYCFSSETIPARTPSRLGDIGRPHILQCDNEKEFKPVKTLETSIYEAHQSLSSSQMRGLIQQANSVPEKKIAGFLVSLDTGSYHGSSSCQVPVVSWRSS